MNEKISRTKLMRDFFGLSGIKAIREIKGLEDKDKAELGSAIARSLGLKQTDVDFELVAY